MNVINADDVIQLLGVIGESKIDSFCLELLSLKLQVNKHRNIEDDIDRESSEVKAAHEGLVPIRAPVLGLFCIAEHHGAPPFVEVGQIVEQGAVLCLIDVLGELHAVKADLPGRIRGISALDGQMVEFDQQIFSLEKIEQQ